MESCRATTDQTPELVPGSREGMRVQAVRETRGYYLEAEGGYTYYLAAEGSSRWEQWLARRELLAALPRRWRPGML